MTFTLTCSRFGTDSGGRREVPVRWGSGRHWVVERGNAVHPVDPQALRQRELPNQRTGTGDFLHGTAWAEGDNTCATTTTSSKALLARPVAARRSCYCTKPDSCS